jgi:hypothetical protein
MIFFKCRIRRTDPFLAAVLREIAKAVTHYEMYAWVNVEPRTFNEDHGSHQSGQSQDCL